MQAIQESQPVEGEGEGLEAPAEVAPTSVEAPTPHFQSTGVQVHFGRDHSVSRRVQTTPRRKDRGMHQQSSYPISFYLLFTTWVKQQGILY